MSKVIDITEEEDRADLDYLTDRTDQADRADLLDGLAPEKGDLPARRMDGMDGMDVAVRANEERQRKAAERITLAYTEARQAMTHAVRRVVVAGLVLLERKDDLPRGAFLPWLQGYCPDVDPRTAQRWMQTASATLGLLEYAADYTCEDGSLIDVLTLPEDVLSEEGRAIQERVFGLVDGTSAKQIVMDYKSTSGGAHQTHYPARRQEAVSKEEAARIQAEQADRTAAELLQVIGVLQPMLPHLEYARLEELHNARVELGAALNAVMPAAKRRWNQKGGVL